MDWFRTTPQQRMLTSSAAGWARRWRWRWRFVSPWRLGWGRSSWVPESQTSTALWAWGSSTASSRLESGTSNWWGWRWSDRAGRSRWSPAQSRHHAHPRFGWGLRAHSLRVSRSEAVKCSAMQRSVAPPQGPTPRRTPPRNRTRRAEAESPLRVARHRPYRVVPGMAAGRRHGRCPPPGRPRTSCLLLFVGIERESWWSRPWRRGTRQDMCLQPRLRRPWAARA